MREKVSQRTLNKLYDSKKINKLYFRGSFIVFVRIFVDRFFPRIRDRGNAWQVVSNNYGAARNGANSRKIRSARVDARLVTIPLCNERREERGRQSHFQSGQSCHRLMECNRTLASHRLALSPSFSFPSRLLPCRFRSPPRASNASADFPLCPRALFALREIRARSRTAPKRRRQGGREREREREAWVRPFVAILRDALSPPHLFPPLLFLYMPSYLKLDSWCAVKNLAAQEDQLQRVEPLPRVLYASHDGNLNMPMLWLAALTTLAT